MWSKVHLKIMARWKGYGLLEGYGLMQGYGLLERYGLLGYAGHSFSHS